MRLIGSGLGLVSFHKMNPRTLHNYLYQNHWLHRLIVGKNVPVPGPHYLNRDKRRMSSYLTQAFSPCSQSILLCAFAQNFTNNCTCHFSINSNLLVLFLSIVQHRKMIYDYYQSEGCNPMKMYILPWIQLPLWFFLSLSFRNLTGFFPSQRKAGTLIKCCKYTDKINFQAWSYYFTMVIQRSQMN